MLENRNYKKIQTSIAETVGQRIIEMGYQQEMLKIIKTSIQARILTLTNKTKITENTVTVIRLTLNGNKIENEEILVQEMMIIGKHVTGKIITTIIGTTSKFRLQTEEALTGMKISHLKATERNQHTKIRKINQGLIIMSIR